MIGRLLCRVGLHKWSDHKGGSQVCLRDECQSATTFGLTGLMRRIQWEKELYEEWHRYADESGGGAE